jgi:hypothetical protein
MIDPRTWPILVWISLWGLVTIPAFARGLSNLLAARRHSRAYHPYNGVGNRILTADYRTQKVMFGMAVAALGVVSLVVLDPATWDEPTMPVTFRGVAFRLLLLMFPAGCALVGEIWHSLARFIATSSEV